MSDNSNDLTIAVSENDHIQGNPDAPIVLVEYGDFECSYCGDAYPIVQQLQADFGDDLCFVFRSFPLAQSHPHAKHAAVAAEIAADAGRFWEYHDALYENQNALDDSSLAAFASELGIDTSTFKQDLENGQYADRVQESFSGGVESGVNGTPSFFVNGSRYDGDWNYEAFGEYLSTLR